MPKINCWEFLKCGREPGGEKVDALGICPAATRQDADGINGGENAGRACWAIDGTLCNGEVQACASDKLFKCLSCDFYLSVLVEERPVDMMLSSVASKMRHQVSWP